MGSTSAGHIGVFDSGVGGLTVLKAIHRLLPHESVLYFGDTARLPYGTRSRSEILQFVREIVGWMEQEHVKLVVMACNTSSALALSHVQPEFSVPILGTIDPAACAAVAGGRRIGVIATPATAASHAFKAAIQRLAPDAHVWEVGCPAFVPLIEQNRIYEPETQAIARAYLAPLLEQGIDTLVYGCTHYPLLDPIIKNLLPPGVRCVDPAAQMAIATAQLISPASHSTGSTRFCVSDCPDHFAKLARQWLGYSPQVERLIPQRYLLEQTASAVS